MEQAQAELKAVGQQLDLEHPLGASTAGEYRARHQVKRDWFLMPATDVRMHESMDRMVGPLVITIMIAVGLVLLVACTNIANLMLARGAAGRSSAGCSVRPRAAPSPTTLKYWPPTISPTMTSEVPLATRAWRNRDHGARATKLVCTAAKSAKSGGERAMVDRLPPRRGSE